MKMTELQKMYHRARGRWSRNAGNDAKKKFDDVREEGGAGEFGTDGLTKKYKKDTPMEGTGSSETWEAGYKRRVVKTTDPEHKEKGYEWRIKGKERSEISIKLYKSKPDFAEFKRQMKRVAGHEFGSR